MTQVFDRSTAAAPASPPDERAARRTLAHQIERLERDLARLRASAWPRTDLGPAAPMPSTRGPRLLGLGELEQVRDALASRVGDMRRELSERERAEDAKRRLIGDMLRDPAAHRWVRVSHADIGQPGCRHWHVVPRWGLLGILSNWWRVKISSGCP